MGNETTADSATINWRGEEDDLGQIEYAKSSYFGLHHCFEKTRSTQAMNQYQHVRLAGLEPDTSYTYRVRPSGNDDAFSPNSGLIPANSLAGYSP
ncbi:MAG TPA: fibronectin type III domain-containing protein, partial [Methanotrichaceae archaeon]|nr:fibronectin type III domain-containing protein [Methanotrichaceae archaeon]